MATAHLVGPKHGWVLNDHDGGDPRARLGDGLKRAREARGLTMAAVAAQTKIPQKHLEALERGDAMGLPFFYQRAEVRSVAHAVGVDEHVALAQLQAALAPVEAQPQPPAQPVRGISSAHMFGAVAAGALTVALVGWGLLNITDEADPGGVSTRQAAPLAPAPTPVRAVGAPATVVPVQNATVAEAAPVDPPVAPTGPTELVVTTEPAGARVTVNGVGWGVSPVIIRHLPPGTVRIRATMAGYAAGERSIAIDEGARQSIRVVLPKPGT